MTWLASNEQMLDFFSLFAVQLTSKNWQVVTGF